MCTDLGNKIPTQQAQPSREPQDYSNKYNTKLSPAEEADFQKWAVQNNKTKDTFDYDLRGAWKEGSAGTGGAHSPDTYKKPNHPTFSNQSKYNGAEGKTGGEWVQQPGGSYTFNASDANVQNMGEQGLRNYFNKYEKGNAVNIPKQRK